MRIIRISELLILQISLLLPNGTLAYSPRTFFCGKHRVKCNFPEQFCDRNICQSCVPECKRPFLDIPYGCEVFCLNDVEASSKNLICSKSSVKNGQLSQNCPGKPGDHCGYTCEEGYDKNPDVSSVACLPSGNWSSDLNTLCFPERMSTEERIGLCVGVPLAVIVITILILMLRHRYKRIINRNEQEGTNEENIGIHPFSEDDGEFAGNEESNIPSPALNSFKDTTP